MYIYVRIYACIYVYNCPRVYVCVKLYICSQATKRIYIHVCVYFKRTTTRKPYIYVDSKTKNSIHLKTRIYRNYVTPIKIIRIAQASLSIYMCVCVYTAAMLRTQPYPCCSRDDGRKHFQDDLVATPGPEDEVVARGRDGLVEPHLKVVCTDDMPLLPLIPKHIFPPAAQGKDHFIVRDRLPLLRHQGDPVSGRPDTTAKLPLHCSHGFGVQQSCL